MTQKSYKIQIWRWRECAIARMAKIHNKLGSRKVLCNAEHNNGKDWPKRQCCFAIREQICHFRFWGWTHHMLNNFLIRSVWPHYWDLCHHFLLNKNGQLLCFWIQALISVIYHYGGPVSYHLLCIWPLHLDVLHNNLGIGVIPSWVALLLWTVSLLLSLRVWIWQSLLS